MKSLHLFRSAKSDAGDSSLVRPSDWNQGHFRYPDTEGSLYDPFETADTDPISGYTTMGSPDVLDTHTNHPSQLYVKEQGAGAVNVVGLYKSWSPSAGKFVETWLTDAVFHPTTSSYVGLFIGEAGGAGKLTLTGIGRYGAVFDDKYILFQYNSRTSFASEPTSILGPWRPPLGLRIVYNSSTSLDFFISHGIGWRKIFAALNPGYTIGIVGVGGDMSASGFSTEAWFDHLNDG